MSRSLVVLPFVALLLLCVMLLQGCASAPQPAPEPSEVNPTRTIKASYAEPICGSIAAFGLISAIGLPGYLIASGFANRACSEVAK